MIEDPRGRDVIKSNDTYRLILPVCGVLRLKSTKLFYESAKWSVRRENGDRITVGSEALADQIALRFGGWRSWQEPTGRYEDFLGTVREFESFDFSAFPTPTCDE